MCAVARKFITGCELCKKKTINLNFYLAREEYFLLTGFVLTPTGEPLPNAALEITLIDGIREQLMGVTFSQEDGMYGISLPSRCSYRIIAYSP